MTPQIHARRRAALMAALDDPILLMGNGTRYRNSAYALPFRQDSNFLYYTGCHQPGAAVLLAEGKSTLFLTPPADDDALWHGHSERIEETAAALGFDAVQPLSALSAALEGRSGVRSVAVPDKAVTDATAALLQQPLAFLKRPGDEGLIDLSLIHI